MANNGGLRASHAVLIAAITLLPIVQTTAGSPLNNNTRGISCTQISLGRASH